MIASRSSISRSTVQGGVSPLPPRPRRSKWMTLKRSASSGGGFTLGPELLRARDTMDRDYAHLIDIKALASAACLSRAHFIRSFRAAFGETPHRYLQRRRVERSMFLLRETDRSVTDVCFDVGFTSLGTFSRTFREIVGETPSTYRMGHGPIVAPHCVQLAAMRPREAAGESPRLSSFGEAVAASAP